MILDYEKPYNPSRWRSYFAQILGRLRSENGFSRSDIAWHLDIDESVVDGWFDLSKTPTVDDLVGLAGLFGVPTDYLLGRAVAS